VSTACSGPLPCACFRSEVPIDPVRRRAAVIATLITLPIVVILALVIGSVRDHSAKSPTPTLTSGAALSPISVAAPPSNAAAVRPCTSVLAALPVSLNGLQSRPALSTSAFVVAWGQPAVVLRCGVPRPSGLVAGSDAFTTGVDGVFFGVDHAKDATVFTVIDRAVYIEVRVPATYAGGPLAPIADAVAKALPAVCVVDGTAPVARQCTHRP